MVSEPYVAARIDVALALAAACDWARRVSMQGMLGLTVAAIQSLAHRAERWSIVTTRAFKLGGQLDQAF